MNNRDEGQDGEGDWDSEDEKESLQRKLARLEREVQEVKSEVERKKTEGTNDTEAQQGDLDVGSKLAQLSAALDGMRQSQSATARLDRQLARPALAQTDAVTIPDSTRNEEATKETPDLRALNKIVDFDTRLTTLERQLGITTLDGPEAPATSPAFTPILPTLSLLDRQIALLTSSSSQSHIEALAQKLQQQTPAPATEDSEPQLPPEDMAKLRALYALLPTLTSLSPTLPPLLARLRSLRTLHANAASASQMLDDIERRQDEADKEIREWREGLKKVEEAVVRAEGGMKENSAAVEGWVKELEERVQKLA